jgi:hypothetical protein
MMVGIGLRLEAWGLTLSSMPTNTLESRKTEMLALAQLAT